MRKCQLVAEVVAVLCPNCGETQPNRDGSEMWTAEDFKGNTLKQCVSCDKPILIAHESKVRFEANQ